MLGETAAVVVDVNFADTSQLPMEYSTHLVSLRKQEPLRLELLDFLDAVKKRRPPFVTGEEGLENLRICERVLGSMRESQGRRAGLATAKIESTR